MDLHQIFLLLAVVVGLWLAIVASRYLIVWLRLMRMRFGPGELHTAARENVPADIAAILDPVAEKLAALGFEFEETVLIDPQLRGGDREPVWIHFFFHAASGSRATLQLSDTPEPGLLAAVVFLTNLSDRLVVTENRRMHSLFSRPPECDIADAGAATLGEHWTFHCRRLETAPGTVVTGLEALRQRQRQLRVGIFSHCGQCGLMRPTGEDWRLTAKGAWSYLRQVIAGTRRVAALPPCTDVENPQLRLLADGRAWRAEEALLERNGMSRRSKVLWFLASAAAGAAAFGYLTSWDLVPAILGVLLFHEFGHALAMRAIGYRGLSVLVLPFLGAVAIGRKDDAGPWQKLAVLLAGPVPGLILAIALLRYGVAQHSADHELLMTVGTLALVINYLNLLPFTPLDGGQIVDTFLFARRPRLRFAFLVMSAVALVTVGLLLKSTAFTAVGLFFALTLPGARRRLRMLAGLGSVADADPVAAILRRMHEAPGPRWPAFAQRMQTVRALLPLVRARAPSFRESLLGLLAYVVAVVLPIALLWDTGLPQQLAAQLTRSSVESYRPPEAPDWKTELARAVDPEARWQVLWKAGQWFEEYEDDTEARLRYEEAFAEAAKLPPGSLSELHLLDTRIALARFSEPVVARMSYYALLPELRSLPAAERSRLADVLEALNRLDYRSPPVERVALLREAIDVRETVETPAAVGLAHDRIELARLLDSTGDAEGAEALLRKNLYDLSGERTGSAAWQLEPVAWFFIAHGRAAEGEALLVAQPLSKGSPARAALAWTRLAQGKVEVARKIFGEELAEMEKRKWPNWQRMELVIDLVRASTDAPDEDAHWIQRATELKQQMSKDFRGFRYFVRGEADSDSWEQGRGRARMEVLKRLPGAADEEKEDANDTCKGSSTSSRDER
jgi:Zn-dependent protease